MRFLFSTGSLYSYGTERCFDLASAAGFDGIEVMVDERWDTRQASYLCALSRRSELPIVAVHSPFQDVPGWPPGHPSLIRQSVKLAEDVGAEVVIHHLPLRLGYAMVDVGRQRSVVPLIGWDMERDYREWLQDEYHRVQTRTMVTLCIENMPARTVWGRRLNVYHWNSVEAITRFPSLTMDTTHLATWDLDPLTVLADWGDRVRHVHLSNFDGKEHRRPEYGQLRLDNLLERLTADNYVGAVTLELHPDALEAGAGDDRVVRLLNNSLRLCRYWASGRASAAL